MNRWRSFLLAAGVAVVGVSGYFIQTERGNLPPMSRERVDRGRLGRAGAPTGSTPAFELAVSYLYPFPGVTGQSRLPVQSASDARSPAVLCTVKVADGCWQCLKRDGTSAGTIGNDGCTGNVQTHISGVLAREVTRTPGDDSPTLTSSYLDGLFGVSSPMTVVMGSLPRNNGLDGYYWGLYRHGGTAGYFQMYSDGSGIVNCGFEPVTAPTGINSMGLGAYTAHACRRDGASSYTATYQTVNAETTSATPYVAISGTGYWSFGARAYAEFPGNGLGWNGALVFVAFYDVRLTDTELADVIDCYEGDCNPNKKLSYRNSQAVGIDNIATTGLVDMMDGATTLVTSTGLLGSSGFRNFALASGSTSVLGAVGVDRNTPTVTPNVYAGPFSVASKTSECALVVDNDGTNFEGKTGVDMGTAEIDYNLSFIGLTGTSGTTTNKVTVGVDVVSGTATPASCTFTLTSTPARYSCIIRLSDTPTSITPWWGVGSVGTETGSVRICQWQPTIGPALEPPVMTAAVVSPIYYTGDATTDGFPAASLGARVEAVHTAGYTSTLWIDHALYNYRVVDPYVAGPSHAGALIHNYTAQGTFYAQGLLTNSVATTVNTLYASAVEWLPVGGGKCHYFSKFDACGVTAYDACHATTASQSDVTGAVDCVGTATNFQLFAREDGTNAGSFRINAINIYTRR